MEKQKGGQLYLEMIIGMMVVRSCLATNYEVGGFAGWSLGVNFSQWTNGTSFFVGDTLSFQYRSGNHNVCELGEAEYNACNVTRWVAMHDSGNDVIELNKEGMWYFACNKENGGHCRQGMKLGIQVQPAPPSPGMSFYYSPSSVSRSDLVNATIAAAIGGALITLLLIGLFAWFIHVKLTKVAKLKRCESVNDSNLEGTERPNMEGTERRNSAV